MRTLDTGTDELLCSVTDHVAMITLNNPARRNAMTDQIGPALRRMLAETESDIRKQSGNQVKGLLFVAKKK